MSEKKRELNEVSSLMVAANESQRDESNIEQGDTRVTLRSVSNNLF